MFLCQNIISGRAEMDEEERCAAAFIFRAVCGKRRIRNLYLCESRKAKLKLRNLLAKAYCHKWQ